MVNHIQRLNLYDFIWLFRDIEWYWFIRHIPHSQTYPHLAPAAALPPRPFPPRPATGALPGPSDGVPPGRCCSTLPDGWLDCRPAKRLGYCGILWDILGYCGYVNIENSPTSLSVSATPVSARWYLLQELGWAKNCPISFKAKSAPSKSNKNPSTPSTIQPSNPSIQHHPGCLLWCSPLCPHQCGRWWCRNKVATEIDLARRTTAIETLGLWGAQVVLERSINGVHSRMQWASVVYILAVELQGYCVCFTCVIYDQRKLGNNFPSHGWFLLNEGWCETLHHITIHSWRAVWDFTSHNNTVTRSDFGAAMSAVIMNKKASLCKQVFV